MQPKLEVGLTKEETEEAVALYVQSHTGYKVSSVKIEIGRTGDFGCLASCEVPDDHQYKSSDSGRADCPIVDPGISASESTI